MSHLRIRPKDKSGRVTHVTPESAGWTHVGFDLHRLKPGDLAVLAESLLYRRHVVVERPDLVEGRGFDKG